MNKDIPLLLTDNYAERDDDCACPDTAFLLTLDHDNNMENDCACPDNASQLTHTMPPAVSRFVQTAVTHTAPLPHGFHLAFSAYAPGGPSVLNPAAWERWQSFSRPQPLTKVIDTELARQMLIRVTGATEQLQASPPQTLTAWLHVTNACNLDCPYCYVRKSSARMDEKTGKQAIDAIFATAQKHGFSRVKIKYAGGEASLHFRLIRQLHRYAASLATQTGLTLKEVILSNGVHLKVADVSWLAKNNVKLMISLDGIGELHNRLRPLRNHAPFDTFHHVSKTIDELLLPRGIKPDITMTVTAVNANGAADVAQWALIDRDLPTSFNFYRQNPLSASRQDLALEENAIIDGMLAAYEVVKKQLPKRPFLNGLLDRIQAQAHTHTCGVGNSYLVINHTGQLAQCQMHLNQPVSTNLDNDLMLPIQNGAIHNLSVHEKQECRSCEFRYRCAGGCPLETYRATGRWDVKSPNCRIYKTLYPIVLHLEGLRLMKYHGYLH